MSTPFPSRAPRGGALPDPDLGQGDQGLREHGVALLRRDTGHAYPAGVPVALLWLLTYLLGLVTLTRQGDNALHGPGRRTDGQDARRTAAGSFLGGTDRVAACRVPTAGSALSSPARSASLPGAPAAARRVSWRCPGSLEPSLARVRTIARSIAWMRGDDAGGSKRAVSRPG